eukprot:TRINITY_DN14998_c2_g1_i1.p1 TRINITY_DN14998_c2_g1~~TRINITY_DN14998_c2_g1_i1.p1  ORF type:complete len:119 (+),score=18.89 TRINITY_DN14998_c2_g1_i1:46-402(+)
MTCLEVRPSPEEPHSSSSLSMSHLSSSFLLLLLLPFADRLHTLIVLRVLLSNCLYESRIDVSIDPIRDLGAIQVALSIAIADEKELYERESERRGGGGLTHLWPFLLGRSRLAIHLCI